MHQSSLGTVMVITGSKLSPLWWTRLLPLFFLISCIFLGYAIVIVESSITGSQYPIHDESKILGKVSAVMAWLIAIFLVIRFADLAMRVIWISPLEEIFSETCFCWKTFCWWFPWLCYLSLPIGKIGARGMFFCAVSIVLAAAIYRFNTYIIGFNPGNGWHYFPSAGEILYL